MDHLSQRAGRLTEGVAKWRPGKLFVANEEIHIMVVFCQMLRKHSQNVGLLSPSTGRKNIAEHIMLTKKFLSNDQEKVKASLNLNLLDGGIQQFAERQAF